MLSGRETNDASSAGSWQSLAFWAGTGAVTIGSILHFPMYFKAADRGFKLVGTPMDIWMKIGMPMLVVGFFVAYFGLARPGSIDEEVELRVRALDEAPLKWDHVALILVMVAAITIDVMKPTALSFLIPGYSLEYGLQSPVNPNASVPASLIAFFGITGTVMGSFIWGWMGDRIGRRGAIIMAGLSFAATGVCGAMPSWKMNVFMCFVMGLGAGGMLPVIFTLITETIPARHRGWLLVLIGGDVAAAYIITSWISSTFVPVYSWRILWLIGIPTGVLLVALTRWIPESPRYLLLHDRVEEARAVMEQYGAEIVEEESSELEVEQEFEDSYGQLFHEPFKGVTIAALLTAFGVGLVTFGFQMWIPSNLQVHGLSESTANSVLNHSALIGFPLNFLVAYLYGFQSSKKTLLGLIVLTALALVGFVFFGARVVEHRYLLYALLLMPIWGISSLTAVLSAYVAELYPTSLRSRGSGMVAGLTKFGGVAILGGVTAGFAAPSIEATALLGAVPLTLAAIATLAFGLETRGRQLEDITAEQVGKKAGTE